VAGAAVVLTALACFTPPAVFEAQDWLLLHLPGKAYAVDALAGGRLPLWNPHVGLGRPFLADIEMAVLYPPNLLYLPVDPATALVALVLAHFALGLAGLLGLGRALGFPRWVGWLISGCFLSSAPVVARLSAGQVPYVQATCYLPLLVLLALRLQDGFSAVRLAGLATALGLQLLCGHPQIAWVSWLGLGAFLLGRALPPTDRPLRSAAAGIGGFGLALLAGLGLSAAMLLPFLELVGQGNRAEPTLRFASGASMEWWYWTSLVVPDGGRRSFYWEFNLYTGLLPAVAGLAGLLRVRERNARGFLLMAVAGFLVAAGPRTPAFGLLYAVVPGLAGFHIHARAGLLVAFALLLGAGLFLSRPWAAGPAFRALAMGSAAVLAGALAVRGTAAGSVPSTLPLERLALGGVVAGLAGLVVAGRSPGIRAGLAPAALSALVLLEIVSTVGPARRGWRVAIPTEGERLIFQALRRGGLYGRSGVPPRVALPPMLSRANAGLLYGWSDFAGYNSLSLNRTWVYVHRALGLDPPLDENTYVSDRVYERGPFPYDSMNLAAGWDAAQGRFVTRHVADPRAYLVPAARRVGDWREAVALMAAGHDVHAEALVETETGLPALDEDGPPGGSVVITAFAPERITLATESASPALLVLAEAWYPGWSAVVDGRDAPCIPANGWMRAVPLSPGRHQVTLSFRSRWLAVGVLVSVATALALAAATGRERGRSGPRLTRPGATPAR
jgi:hypothetical protein